MLPNPKNHRTRYCQLTMVIQMRDKLEAEMPIERVSEPSDSLKVVFSQSIASCFSPNFDFYLRNTICHFKIKG